jgi:MinD superfamily P-loop ATPase
MWACEQVCRFGAISGFKVNELKCEGCAACTVVCPEQAITLDDEVTGTTILRKPTRAFYPMRIWKLGQKALGSWLPKSEKMRGDTRKKGTWFYWTVPRVWDARVMASLTGCDAALLVVEPTQSGLADFLRVLEVVRFFKIKPYVCINKYDLNNAQSREIFKVCWKEKSAGCWGRFPSIPW